MIGRRLLRGVALIAVLGSPSGGFADSLMETLLRVAGLTVAPAQLRGPGDKVEPGSIWIANLDRQTVGSVTPDGGYHSPVFSPADGSLLALKGDFVVHVPAGGGSPVPIQRIAGAVKLVGFDGRNPADIVVLFESDRAPLAVVSLRTGKVAPLPYNAASPEQQRMLTQIRGQERVYGTTRLYVKAESRQGLSRAIEWTDVYLRRGDSPPSNVSGCDGVSCGQPALSPDGRRVAFVKAAD
jgi:hypothetical protein